MGSSASQSTLQELLMFIRATMAEGWPILIRADKVLALSPADTTCISGAPALGIWLEGSDCLLVEAGSFLNQWEELGFPSLTEAQDA